MRVSRREFFKVTGSTTVASALLSRINYSFKSKEAAPLSVPAKSSDLCFMSARELATLIHSRKLSAREVMAAYLGQINRLNPKVNAIVAKLDDDQCLALADEADLLIARREKVGPLHGLPIAFKDLEAAVGFPWTRGSRIYGNDMPTEDTVLVERLRKAGVIPIGKTNVSEFGMGSHTYNKVYGTTLNPYDLTKSAGGSSGGAGAALATGLLPLADGSDLGGSLRNPANFNNIVASAPYRWPRPHGPNRIAASRILGQGAHGPLGRRHCLPAERDGRVRLPRSRLLSLQPHGVRQASGPQPQGRAGRLVPGPRGPPARPTSSSRSGSAARNLRASRLHRRGSLSRSEWGGRSLPQDPRVAILEYAWAIARKASS